MMNISGKGYHPTVFESSMGKESSVWAQKFNESMGIQVVRQLCVANSRLADSPLSSAYSKTV